MLNMIAAALVAAAPVMPAPPADAHAQHHQMGQQPGAKPGMMADMKDCCKDKMAKMKGEHAGHQASADQQQNHK